MNFKTSETKKNLARAFAAECQDGARYQFMAKQAEADGLIYIKLTLKSLAKNEMAHAKLFYDYLLEEGGDNFKAGFSADYPYIVPELKSSLIEDSKLEKELGEEIYPAFAKVAKEEGFNDIAETFEMVAKVEKSHAQILNFLGKNYKGGGVYKQKEKHVLRCSNCGHISLQKQGWDICPLCNLGQGYIEIDYSKIYEDVACK
ncbi:MAG: rubrerythrin family protein [Clostridia bacterium]|nr:rubrerythrin family protein [Clostridia bacterium]